MPAAATLGPAIGSIDFMPRRRVPKGNPFQRFPTENDPKKRDSLVKEPAKPTKSTRRFHAGPPDRAMLPNIAPPSKNVGQKIGRFLLKNSESLPTRRSAGWKSRPSRVYRPQPKDE
jgi:hypothetical protein